jgi:hypothetical protein
MALSSNKHDPWEWLVDSARKIAPFCTIVVCSLTVFNTVIWPLLQRTPAAHIAYVAFGLFAFLPTLVFALLVGCRRWDLIGSKHSLSLVLGFAVIYYHVGSEFTGTATVRENIAKFGQSLAREAPSAEEADHVIRGTARYLNGNNDEPVPEGSRISLYVLTMMAFCALGLQLGQAALVGLHGEEMRALYQLRLENDAALAALRAGAADQDGFR